MYREQIPDVEPPILNGLSYPHFLDGSNDTKQKKVDATTITNKSCDKQMKIKGSKNKGKHDELKENGGWFSDQNHQR
jgi:hypothetical protein